MGDLFRLTRFRVVGDYPSVTRRSKVLGDLLSVTRLCALGDLPVMARSTSLGDCDGMTR